MCKGKAGTSCEDYLDGRHTNRMVQATRPFHSAIFAGIGAGWFSRLVLSIFDDDNVVVMRLDVVTATTRTKLSLAHQRLLP